MYSTLPTECTAPISTPRVKGHVTHASLHPLTAKGCNTPTVADLLHDELLLSRVVADASAQGGQREIERRGRRYTRLRSR
eukprot:scaffold70538_cov56-Phaeocystis_antarctica.AAC.1